MSAAPVLSLPFVPTVTVVEVTPEVARRWLEANTHNRNVRPVLVSGFARDMTAGRWRMTGEAIKFAADGTLLDGQHRLHAVIRSGVSVPMLVVGGLDLAAQGVMDSGAKRQAADVLRLTGHKNPCVLAAAARLGIALGSDTKAATSRKGSYGNVTNSEVAEFITHNPDIEHAASRAVYFRDSIDAPTSATAYVYWRCARVDARATEEFFSALGNHETTGKGDPRAALLRRLNSARRNGEALGQVVYVSLFLRAWNAWRKGRQLTSIPAESRTGGASIPVPR